VDTVQHLNLLDLSGRLVDVWLVFRNVARPHRPLWRWLKDGFHHIEIWQKDRGAWVRFDPCLDVSVFEVSLLAPWESVDESLRPTCMRVNRCLVRRRLHWHIGPLTCVDQAKAAIGLRAAWIVTPYQLYRYLRR
jgi:hypothetical protein